MKGEPRNELDSGAFVEYHTGGGKFIAIRCEKCGREHDATLFQFGRTVQCDCGNVVMLSGVQTIRQTESAARLILVRHGEAAARGA